MPVTCPKCHSDQITAQKKGFGVGKALVGDFLIGRFGLIAGGAGRNRILITCLQCGYAWDPAASRRAKRNGIIVLAVILIVIVLKVSNQFSPDSAPSQAVAPSAAPPLSDTEAVANPAGINPTEAAVPAPEGADKSRSGASANTDENIRCPVGGNATILRGIASQQSDGVKGTIWILRTDMPFCLMLTPPTAPRQRAILSSVQIDGLPPPVDVEIELKGTLYVEPLSPDGVELPRLSVTSGRRLETPVVRTPNVQAQNAVSAIKVQPSFDCAKTSNGVERLICSDNDLAALDVKMVGLYRQALTSVADQNEFRGEQQDWLSRRDGCTNTPCVIIAYNDRIKDLNRWLGQ